MTVTRLQHTVLAIMCVMASKFYKIGANATGSTGLCFSSKTKSFKHDFAVNPHVCVMIMDRMSDQFNVVACRMCLLWSLHFLCCYPKVKVTRKVFEVDVKAFRKHASEIKLFSKELKTLSSRELCLI